MTEITAWFDLIPLLAAALIPALSAYVGRTNGQRTASAAAAAVALAVITVLAKGDFDAKEVIETGAEAFVAQLTAYLAIWKPLDLNGRAEQRRDT